MVKFPSKRILVLSTAAITVACLILVVVFVRPHLSAPPDVSHPVMRPGEKLPAYDDNEHYFRRYAPPFEVNCPFPEVPGHVLVYKRVAPKVLSDDDFREFALRHFDIPKSISQRHSKADWGYKIKTDEYLFTFQKYSGFFKLFVYEGARTAASRDRPDFPSDDKCIEIATNYLKKHNLYEDNMYISSVIDNTKAGVMSVSFKRSLSSFKTWGAGSRCIIDIAPDGQVVKIMKNYATYKPWKTAPIITPQQALHRLRSGYFFGMMPDFGGEITEISLRYETERSGEYAMPIYHFEYTTDYDTEEYAIVAAIDPNYGQRPPKHMLPAKEYDPNDPNNPPPPTNFPR